jgi:hypothetical protein
MADDRITIDPEFLPPSREGGGRRTAWFAAGAAVVAAIAFGWLLGSPGPTESSDVAATDLTSTTVTTTTTSTTVATTTTVPPAPRLADAGAPLSQLVPGFTDTIVMLTTPSETFDVTRWNASEPTTNVVLSIDRDPFGPGGGWPIGLDASGSWFARVLEDGVLAVHSIPDTGEEIPTHEAVGLRVGSAVWHDTIPGQLAWLTCSRSSPGPTVLTTLDLHDGAAEPVPLRSFEQECAYGRGNGVFLQSWSEDGLAVDVLWDQPPSPISSHVDGTLIPAKPGDLTPVEGLDDTPPRPVPGLTDTELLVDASWSPDGTLIAVNITPDIDSPNSVVRIVDSTTGAVLTETDWQGSGVISMTWSTDGRFLLYPILHSTHEHTGPGSLVIHDPTTDVTTTIPLNEFVDEIRTNIGDEPG